ncbi:hypothetical protein QQS21_006497 [Conoideocrella luteorostrata]|uniref:Zn(2)-C6 fungal-type domain-containing protein n=1 Tax=Conoideocrella luteorostrata TaxID=1105319 RepID=A0AAJ0CMH8_9HYPO|nr:hypothetical protein QQS21_006497 [Conoideocrella luteorostrata]
MADFLASFNFGADDDFAPRSNACKSVGELQQRLQKSVDEKTTKTRAERVTTRLEIAGTAEFIVTLTQARKHDAGIVDPALSGGDPMEVQPTNENESQTCVFTALELIRKQPSAAPAVQEVVAEQIVEAASAADKSTWVLHQSEMTPSGWTFTFLCEESTKLWNFRNTGKKTAIVGDYKKKDPDPIQMNRPAFDCRGCVTISFPKKDRTISVKYNHIALHKRVAGLVEFYRPPPMIGPQKPDKATLQWAQKKTQDEAGKAKRKAYRAAKRQEDISKRMKINDTQDTQTQSSLADQVIQALGNVDVIQPQQTMATEKRQNGGNSEAAADSMESQPPSATAKAPLPLVSPEEAARRMEMALKSLADAGINHESLSTDQLNIFANQAPDLQRESLNMLIIYGAERLQIIHPNYGEDSNPIPPSPAPIPDDAGSHNLSTTTRQLVLEDEITKGKGKGKGRGNYERPLGKSRLACYQCRIRRVKCPRERPVCTECQGCGRSCEYPPQTPRIRKPQKSDAIVAGGAGADAEEEDGETTAGDTTLTETHDKDTPVKLNEPQHALQDVPHETGNFQQYAEVQYSPYPQIPTADLSPGAPDDDPIHGADEPPTQLPYYQVTSGSPVPQPDPLDDPPRRALNSSLALPEDTMFYTPYSLPVPAPELQHEPREQLYARTMTASSSSSSNNHMRQASNGARNNSTASNWGQSTNPPSRSATHLSPLLQHSFLASYSPDPVTAATHGLQMQHVHGLVHAASSHDQRYTPNSSVKMQRRALAQSYLLDLCITREPDPNGDIMRQT